MKRFQYFCGGKLITINLQSILETTAQAHPRRGRQMTTLMAAAPQESGERILRTLAKQRKRFTTRFSDLSEATLMLAPARPAQATVIPTECVVVDGARTSEMRWLHNKFGTEVVQEGRRGKALLQVPSDGGNGVNVAACAARELFQRGHVAAAHPNFLRLIQRPGPSARSSSKQWALDNPGQPGIIGADVHALAAWTITSGSPGIRVAVLDEGVDTGHPYLRGAVVEEADFVDEHAHARPDGDDAHGTACAGIISSQNKRVRGLAPQTGLVAVRIAKSNAAGFWIFDDFDTADAIDWAWGDAQVDVLSNSWGGGPPVDVIINSFERARTRGRSGRGAVVVVAAGNDAGPVSFPGNLDTVLTVGASNQWDEQKTPRSRDGEQWWGSNFGPELDLVAPGVQVRTTDIRGRRGYERTLVTGSFNGTSAATPHVAAAAALILSVAPRLPELRVRELIKSTADPLTTDGLPNDRVGHGRLNTYAALRAARREAHG
jgi:subtilisin family serine protease